MKDLNWKFDRDAIEWLADASTGTDNVRWTWNIGLCEDGTFSPDASDADLKPEGPVPTFKTLDEAKAWCAQWDAVLLTAGESDEMRTRLEEAQDNREDLRDQLITAEKRIAELEALLATDAV